MNVEIDLGKVWLPEELVIMVRDHKKFMLEQVKDNDYFYELLLNSSFSVIFSDFIKRNYYKLKE